MVLQDLNDYTLPGFISRDSTPALVYFHAPWSKPARTMLPVIQELSESYDGMIRFGLVDIEHARQAVNEHGVLNLPTYLLYKQKRQADRFIGLLTKEKLTERLERSLQGG